MNKYINPYNYVYIHENIRCQGFDFAFASVVDANFSCQFVHVSYVVLGDKARLELENVSIEKYVKHCRTETVSTKRVGIQRGSGLFV